MESPVDVKNVVREKYGEAAQRVARGDGNGCCGASRSGCGGDPITSNLYDSAQAGSIPEKAMLASLGCGNPTALAELKPGETVVFSWITYKSRAQRDRVNAKVMADKRLADMMDVKSLPFDAKRMIFGGFESLVKA